MGQVRTGLRGVIRAAQLRRAGGLRQLFIDVDGTLTDGLMYVDRRGFKVTKGFGADDSDAIRTLRKRYVDSIDISLITADEAGMPIAEARAAAMKVDCVFVPGKHRASFIAQRQSVVYIGDGWYDGEVFKAASFGLATANALPHTKRDADAVLSRRGGDKAVAQAVRYIMAHLT